MHGRLFNPIFRVFALAALVVSCGFSEDYSIFETAQVSGESPRLALKQTTGRNHHIYTAWTSRTLPQTQLPEFCLELQQRCRENSELWTVLEKANISGDVTAYRSKNPVALSGPTTVTIRWPGEGEGQWVYRQVRIERVNQSELGDGDDDDSTPPQQQTQCHKAEKFICEVELAVVRLTNDIRKRRGLSELQHHKEIAYSSRLWSDAQARRGSIGHGGFPRQRYADYRQEFGRLDIVLRGENVAMFGGGGNLTAEQVASRFVNMWFNSAGHRRNMLQNGITLHGTGVTQRGNSFYATQMFGNPN